MFLKLDGRDWNEPLPDSSWRLKVTAIRPGMAYSPFKSGDRPGELFSRSDRPTGRPLTVVGGLASSGAREMSGRRGWKPAVGRPSSLATLDRLAGRSGGGSSPSGCLRLRDSDLSS
eukprot:1663246-Rhodomonas_salina.1